MEHLVERDDGGSNSKLVVQNGCEIPQSIVESGRNSTTRFEMGLAKVHWWNHPKHCRRRKGCRRTRKDPRSVSGNMTIFSRPGDQLGLSTAAGADNRRPGERTSRDREAETRETIPLDEEVQEAEMKEVDDQVRRSTRVRMPPVRYGQMPQVAVGALLLLLGLLGPRMGELFPPTQLRSVDDSVDDSERKNERRNIIHTHSSYGVWEQRCLWPVWLCSASSGAVGEKETLIGLTFGNAYG
ncbi:hypothetical protein OUZ56_017680 [Daphnia magna]|uniref:Uncharacterized protein n=1 Tax=Daphnia magna TaxID=35525 RepID=A0ABR0ATD5_9CRUS|nr:hypothetical protein OUZ56_017680 [Daphnia magna]